MDPKDLSDFGGKLANMYRAYICSIRNRQPFGKLCADVGYLSRFPEQPTTPSPFDPDFYYQRDVIASSQQSDIVVLIDTSSRLDGMNHVGFEAVRILSC